MAKSILGTRFVLDEEKILKKKYDQIEKKALKFGLIKIDKNTYQCKGDQNDLNCLNIFVHNELMDMPWFMECVKEWWWLGEKDRNIDLLAKDTKKLIIFEFNEEELARYFDDLKEPYKLLENFILEHGFEYKKGFGYISKENMSFCETSRLSTQIGKQFTWLDDCLKKFDILSIGETRDMTAEFKKMIAEHKTSKPKNT